MKLTLLCNAGFALELPDAMLLVDAPNREIASFYALPEETWQKILNKEPPYDKVCGFWFTHDHPDHFDRNRMEAYLARWPKTPVFLPVETTATGRARMGPFTIEYCRMDHAPIPGAPPHVVSLITAGKEQLYVSADAALIPALHRAFLRQRKADAALWNSMYLSRPETRALMQETTTRNYIYHMPKDHPDREGLWRKLEINFNRSAAELQTVTVLEDYPSIIET